MPHVIVKMYSGKSDTQKSAIAEEVAKAIMKATGHGEESVSVSIEDVAPKDWAEKVFRPDIIGKPDSLYKKPGYNPL
ncbi:4-oxalocrotonate tautomerase [Rhizobiales bacterium GAS188]|nr:4-oxalocrotonate tautomerase [Rhizobiales bacterium GAS188]